MVDARTSRPPAASLLLAHAEMASIPRTAEAAEICNLHKRRTRDFLVQAPAIDTTTAEGPLGAGEFERARDAALTLLRARCGACGICLQHGMKSP